MIEYDTNPKWLYKAIEVNNLRAIQAEILPIVFKKIPNFMTDKPQFMHVMRDEIEPLLTGLRGVKISDYGLDSHDKGEFVVEITYDPSLISDLEIFKAINNPEKGIGDLANSVGESFRERA